MTELDDCGTLFTHGTRVNQDDFRLSDRLLAGPGVASVLFTRRAPLPLSGLEQPIKGTGALSVFQLASFNESTEVSTSMSFIERLPARESEIPATLSLSVRGQNLSELSFADIKVFDHDTDELLISWNLDDLPITSNNGSWYQQEINFNNRMGHAIRYEFEAIAQTRRDVTLQAATYLNLPEPYAATLFIPGMIMLGLLRTRRTMAQTARHFEINA